MRLALIAAVLLAAVVVPVSASARTVHLYGDSIHFGWGFGQYDHPSFLNRIDQTATILAETNGSDLRFRRAGTQEPEQICADVQAGIIQADDLVVFEDAGPRTWDGDLYRSWVDRAAMCAGARLVVGTMFDYSPNMDGAEYDVPLVQGYTANDVFRYVAAAHHARLVDWNLMMDTARARLEPLGVRVVHPDGIHPTVWGNILMAASLVHAAGVPTTNVDTLVWEAVAWKWQIIPQANAPSFDVAEAAAWVRLLVDTAGEIDATPEAPRPATSRALTVGRLGYGAVPQ